MGGVMCKGSEREIEHQCSNSIRVYYIYLRVINIEKL